ncbi:hypothetical protein [Glutamicibacter arilaitensis]|uniref:hypothetical protein n=1 Tax=Glutamicibacter arilaitensis TaxID=256701 RepID=UPI003A8E5E4E
MIHISDSGEAPLPFGNLTFKYAMTNLRHGYGVKIFADTRAELVAYLITGRPIDDAELSATQLRRFAKATAAHLQEELLDQLLGSADELYLSEQLAAVLDGQDIPLQYSLWPDDAQVPLVRLSTSFAPHTAIPVPEGDHVILLDPTNEKTLLESMEQAGLIEVEVGQARLGGNAYDDFTYQGDVWGNPLIEGLIDSSWLDDTQWLDEE